MDFIDSSSRFAIAKIKVCCGWKNVCLAAYREFPLSTYVCAHMHFIKVTAWFFNTNWVYILNVYLMEARFAFSNHWLPAAQLAFCFILLHSNLDKYLFSLPVADILPVNMRIWNVGWKRDKKGTLSDTNESTYIHIQKFNILLQN